MYKNAFELKVCINGKPVKEYSHIGKSFVEAKEGSQYTIKLSNNSNTRALAIFSIDGLDTIKGKSAEETKTGYIVDSYSSIEVKGYRVSDEDVAAFVFSKGYNSYASEKGKASNNGVVGVRLFAEKFVPILPTPIVINNWPIQPIQPWPYPNSFTISGTGCGGFVGGSNINNANITYTSNGTVIGRSLSAGNMKSKQLLTEDIESVDSACLNSMEQPKENLFDLGTAWGNQINDSVVKVEFDRGDPIGDLEILYASRGSLESMGIDFRHHKQICLEKSLPKAFNDNYCKPPKNWKK